ncbi:MAG TPA: hypothetical protein VFT56_01005 [Sphingomonas sp.]|nr:hypothetical protein [Sphingomonas sp.]
MSVEQDYAAYLKADALYVTAAAPDAGRWPAGKQIEVTSSMATVAGGQAEAVRQATFQGGPKVRDQAVVVGRRRDLIGRVITGVAAALGYDAGVPVFVLGAAEQPDNTTTLTVLRRL